MIFDTIPVEDSIDTLLAHTLRVEDKVYRKGTVISLGDVEQLVSAGVKSIAVARLEPGDVREDEVANSVASALAGNNISLSVPASGRCNLLAQASGVLEIKKSAVDTLNATGAGVLCATLNNYSVVDPGRTLATVKVIPYAVTGKYNDTLIQNAGDNAIQVNPFVKKRVSLILTKVTKTKPSILEKSRAVLTARVETCKSDVVQNVTTTHDVQSLSNVIVDAVACSDLVLVLGGASTVDRRDIVPAAIEQAGGSVDLFGVPLDPGNLFVNGEVRGVPVFGLPGCARSPKMNGIDVILPRAFADMTIDRKVLLELGVGGLLHDVAERAVPRTTNKQPIARSVSSNVAAVVLAAGSSRRMGEKNKLLQTIDDQPMVRHVVDVALASQASPVIVVTGYDAAAVRLALSGCEVVFVHNPQFEEGLSTSVRTGVGHVPVSCAGAIMLLGDMPLITCEVVDALGAAFKAHGANKVVVPVCKGRANRKRGNPVVWPRAFFSEMMDLSGDVGARSLLKRHQDNMIEVEVENNGIFFDVDTQGDLKSL